MTKYIRRTWLILIPAAFVMLILAGCGDKSVEKTASFEGSKVQQIEVKTDGQSIQVSRSKDSDVKLRMKTEGELPAVLEEGVLTVGAEPASGFIHLKNETIYLELPEQSYEYIRLATASGNITFEDGRGSKSCWTPTQATSPSPALRGRSMQPHNRAPFTRRSRRPQRYRQTVAARV